MQNVWRTIRRTRLSLVFLAIMATLLSTTALLAVSNCPVYCPIRKSGCKQNLNNEKAIALQNEQECYSGCNGDSACITQCQRDYTYELDDAYNDYNACMGVCTTCGVYYE